jgi:lysophospholipase L1-like esterase
MNRRLFINLLAVFLAAPLFAGTIIEKCAKVADPFFILGASHEDSVGNSTFFATGTVVRNASCNGPSWATILGGKQALSQIGRYTPQGGPALSWQTPTPLGRVYATGSASITTSLNGGPTLIGQINQLLADYPNGLPKGSVVFIDIGINDITNSMGVGGQWTSAANSGWTVNGLQTIPNATQTMAITVTSSAGAAAGATNYIVIPITGGLSTSSFLIPITATTGTSISFNQNIPALNGFTIPNGGVITTYAQFGVQGEMTSLTPVFTNLVNAVAAASGTIVWVTPIDNQLLPNWSAQQTLAHWTYLMFMNQISTILAESQVNVRQLDLAPLCADINSSPTKYGFKDYTTIWNNSGVLSPQDLAWWDNFHPTEAQMRVWANYAIEQFYRWGLIQDDVF